MDVQPDKQSIDIVFSNTTYYIDFYQRQYKWNDVPVKRLLDDVFFRFKTEYSKHVESDIPLDKLIDEYGWYYLNSYVTNKSEGKLYIVDGQQRLTTLTLILIKLMHLAKRYDSKLSFWVSNKIVGQSGYSQTFWMNHESHITAMQELFDGKEPSEINTSSGLTAKNMVANYKVISLWLDKELISKHIFESFVFYFLKRLVLINLNVEQTDVPMVFEVINDRGVRLKPYEILKGKLLGQVEKKELETLKLNELWDERVDLINSYNDDEIDSFFTYYLRSQFANTIGESKKFDKDYHRVLFQKDINDILQLEHSAKHVKSFLQNEFRYYTALYERILGYENTFNEDFEHVYFNKLNDMSTQFLLILSGCKLNDENEDEKIKLISKDLDRLFCLLQLQRSYDSNSFATIIYKVSAEIRAKDVDEIHSIFDKYLKELLSEARSVKAEEVLNYAFFKDTGIELGKRFKRYFFARIERFIAQNTNMQMKQNFYDLVVNTGTVNGFHIEHILAENIENHTLFNDDMELFERERNRLGGLLLLKGKDNISSNNESYTDKLKSYAGTLYWNETLLEDTYKSKLDFQKMIRNYSLDFRAMSTFGISELEERHKLLFDITKHIWS